MKKTRVTNRFFRSIALLSGVVLGSAVALGKPNEAKAAFRYTVIETAFGQTIIDETIPADSVNVNLPDIGVYDLGIVNTGPDANDPNGEGNCFIVDVNYEVGAPERFFVTFGQGLLGQEVLAGATTFTIQQGDPTSVRDTCRVR